MLLISLAATSPSISTKLKGGAVKLFAEQLALVHTLQSKVLLLVVPSYLKLRYEIL